MARRPQHDSDHDLPAGRSQPALSALRAAGYTRLEQLAGVRASELLKLHGLGPQSIPVLRAALQARGLSLAD